MPARDGGIIDMDGIVRGTADCNQLFDQFVGYPADYQLRHWTNIVEQLCWLPTISTSKRERFSTPGSVRVILLRGAHAAGVQRRSGSDFRLLAETILIDCRRQAADDSRLAACAPQKIVAVRRRNEHAR